ncbi:putative ankyrin repeat protein RF_0381 [Artemia franciscana]
MPLWLCTLTGNLEICTMLLDKGANVNVKKNDEISALHIATQNRHGNIVKLLLKYGADVDGQTIKGETALHFAIQRQNVKVVETILEYNANVNLGTKNGDMPLWLSSLTGNVEICTMLLDKGANVNVKKNDGISVLHIAAKNHQGNMVKLLLKYGARINSRDKDGKTALHYACHSKYVCVPDTHGYIIKLLLKHGARLNSRDKDGKTALHYACHSNYVRDPDIHRYIIKLLLKDGARVNSQDNDGRTALHYACYNGCNEVVEELLEHGSDINIMSKNGCTALAEMDPYLGESIGKLIVCLIAKMKTAYLYVSENNIQWYGEMVLNNFDLDIEDERETQDHYLRELAKMRNEKIANSNISLYDILVKGTSSLAACMRNENIVEISKTVRFETQFPSYASILKNQFRKGMERNKLLEPANRCFNSLLNGYPELPYECAEKILNYIINEDLQNLIDAFEPDCVS